MVVFGLCRRKLAGTVRLSMQIVCGFVAATSENAKLDPTRVEFSGCKAFCITIQPRRGLCREFCEREQLEGHYFTLASSTCNDQEHLSNQSTARHTDLLVA